ncbi:hypothetical protein [Photobacterium leiognathi]|nr:hypothetical protein [Photobacterium leiognathi]
MRIQHICPYCMNEAFDSTGAEVLSFKVAPHMIHDSGVHYFKCKKNHEYAVVLDAAKYEVLFDVGMNALNDGYMREAVSSFASSLERFYEFFIKFQMKVSSIDSDLVDNAWKLVSNQSERQLGAFSYLYILAFNDLPPELSSDDRGFRNKVIHKGYIPSTEEALSFGKVVYHHIMAVISEIEDKYGHDALYDFYTTQTPNAQSSWIVSESAKSMNASCTSNGTCVRDFESVLNMFRR